LDGNICVAGDDYTKCDSRKEFFAVQQENLAGLAPALVPKETLAGPVIKYNLL
jgi:hypothetical protein